MRVRILETIYTPSQAFMPGSVVEVDKETAKSWIKKGLAELDKSLERPPEVKEGCLQEL